ncbi:hypothetical protein ACFVIK_02400 [Paenibacillus chitinolyticus]|uniref:hypothetical protein n=1 Tax=Paenibacillus chitinolyticus TaxID=79263 RepID=UPI003640D57B
MPEWQRKLQLRDFIPVWGDAELYVKEKDDPKKLVQLLNLKFLEKLMYISSIMMSSPLTQ